MVDITLFDQKLNHVSNVEMHMQSLTPHTPNLSVQYTETTHLVSHRSPIDLNILPLK